MKLKSIRFIKDTIGKMYWELQVLEYKGIFLIWKSHLCKNGGDEVKQVQEIVSREKAERYIKRNEKYIVEQYEYDPRPEQIEIFNNYIDSNKNNQIA